MTILVSPYPRTAARLHPHFTFLFIDTCMLLFKPFSFDPYGCSCPLLTPYGKILTSAVFCVMPPPLWTVSNHSEHARMWMLPCCWPRCIQSPANKSMWLNTFCFKERRRRKWKGTVGKSRVLKDACVMLAAWKNTSTHKHTYTGYKYHESWKHIIGWTYNLFLS